MLLRDLTACLAIICRGVAKEGELGWPWCPPIIIPEQPCVEVTAIVGKAVLSSLQNITNVKSHNNMQ